jgi:hypothetical protein
MLHIIPTAGTGSSHFAASTAAGLDAMELLI